MHDPEDTPPHTLQFTDVRRLLDLVLRGMAAEWLLRAELLAREVE